ncbi:MAG: hypothetical protein LBP55_04245 [Candidatus Adiutrix sp.]|jgi:hypothetical protein|nr:hypothetical protein [Candidatus Adiutrix sp.]
MKLFDLSGPEALEARRLIRWHLGYVGLVAFFFWVIYYFGFFKASPFLREGPIFIYLAPLVTIVFVAVSPWRGRWLRAARDTRDRLDGEPVFCLMAALVFYFGFYLYSLLLWALAALGPSIFYM